MAKAQRKSKSKNISIKLKAYDARQLDSASHQIVEASKRTGAVILGPIPLPTQTRKFTVLKSTHVNKKSREQFEMRVHKRLIQLCEYTPATIERLKTLNVPAGVDIAIRHSRDTK